MSKTFQQLVETCDVDGLLDFMKEHGLILDENTVIPSNDASRSKLNYLAELYDRRQLSEKIRLNSLYGALLNESLRFYDPRVGQSVTLTGRSITRHMISKTNEVITGKYEHTGGAVIAGDTDSCYFSAYEVLRDNPDFADFEWSRENVVLLYDQIADEVNASFPDFMQKAFNTSHKRGSLIKAGRELVGSKALFIKKKKYAILIYDMEGDRVDVNGKPGKLKPMGLDLKRADTPKFMQEFLERLLIDLLVGKPQEELFEDVKRFREEFKRRPGWEKGTPKAVKAFSDFVKREAEMEKKSREMGALTKGKKAKIDMPGHVRASINWNTLCDEHNDRFSMRISDGSKVIVCKLKANLWGFDSIAYPIDEANLPDWFKGLPFDDELMEETIIDNKLMNLVGVLDWDLTKTKDSETDDFFDFGG